MDSNIIAYGILFLFPLLYCLFRIGTIIAAMLDEVKAMKSIMDDLEEMVSHKDILEKIYWELDMLNASGKKVIEDDLLL